MNNKHSDISITVNLSIGAASRERDFLNIIIADLGICSLYYYPERYANTYVKLKLIITCEERRKIYIVKSHIEHV